MAVINGAQEKKTKGEEPREAVKKSKKPSKEKQTKLNVRLCLAAMEGDGPGVEDLLRAGADPDAGNRHGLAMSAKKGEASSVKILLAASKIEEGSPEALMWAASEGHAECVSLLCAKKYNAKSLEIGLQAAALGGHKACVLELFERVESSEAKLVAIGVAAACGQAEVVALFLGMGVGRDESALIELMQRASEGGHEATVEVIGSFLDGVELSKTVLPSAASDKSGFRL